MLNKKNFILFIILLILAGAAWVYSVPYKNRQEVANAPAKDNFLNGINPMNVDRVSVTAGNKSVTITKTNNTWTLEPNQWPTEQILIDSLIEKLGSISTKDWEVVSNNPEKKYLYEVDDKGKLVVLSKEGNTVAELMFGKVNSAYTGNYISRENDDNTYLAPETFVRALDIDSWADMTITSLTATNIENFTLQYPGQTIEATNAADSRGEIYWHTTKPYTQRLSEEKVTKWLEKAVQLEAVEIPKQDLKVDNKLTIIFDNKGVPEKITIGDLAPNSKYYLLKQESSGRIYLISKETRDDLFIQINDLK